jgi:hypothetical protein
MLHRPANCLESFAASSENEVLTGDHAVFPGPREIERSWEIVGPLLQAWEEGGRPAPCARGSWGPEEAKALPATRGAAAGSPRATSRERDLRTALRRSEVAKAGT